MYGLADNSLFLEHSLHPTHTFFFLFSFSLMITDHWVSANLRFHREEVGSSWNAGVALGADQPSGGKAHLEEKQSMMGLECGKIKG